MTSGLPRELVGLEFNNDGSKMFVLFDGNGGPSITDDVSEYNLTSAFDISTASYVQKISVSNREIYPKGLAFNNDGTKFYVTGGHQDKVNEYNLTSAFDLSNWSYGPIFGVNAQDNSPSGIAFNNDGTKMYVAGYAQDNVNEYNLTSAFNVNTASYVQDFSVYAQDNIPLGIAFNNDGTKMYVVGGDGDDVNEYSLDNPSSPSVCVNEAITDIVYNTTGATGIGTPTDLPTGVTAAWSSNVLTISGTPTASGTYAYSVPLTGGCGTVAAT